VSTVETKPGALAPTPEAAPLRVAVGVADDAADVTLDVSTSSCWARFLGPFPLPDDGAIDRLAAAIEARPVPPARVELIGAPAACALPALWLRTIWLDEAATIALAWPRVEPPGADHGERLAARLCAGLVDHLDAAGPALDEWGLAPGPQTRPGPEAFDVALGLVDAWDVRVQWTLGAGRSEWLCRMRAALEACAARGERRVALYGAGTHTRALGAVLMEPPVEIVCIIDDNADGDGRLWGYPVVTRDAALALGLDAVVLSANTWEDRLWEAGAPLREAGIPVHRLYGTTGR
jgi:hypothetical protein